MKKIIVLYLVCLLSLQVIAQDKTTIRFINVNKKGNAVDCEALRPSEPQKLMKTLNCEISK